MRTPSALGHLLFGKIRGGILGFLFPRPNEEFSVRQIIRSVGASPGSIHRELQSLAETGILRSRTLGTHLFYRANESSPFFHELRGLILKTVGAAELIQSALQSIRSQITIAFLFGSTVKGEEHSASDIDLMVVGEVNFRELVRALADSQRQLGRDINPTVYPSAEFSAKMRAGHHFVNSVVAGPKVFVVGDADELARLAEERLAPTAHSKPRRNREPSDRHRARSQRKQRSKS